MLDKERISRRIIDLERYADRLKSIMLENRKSYISSSYELKAAAERYLQLISDTELEIALLLYKGLELSIAGDEASLLEKIEGVIGKRATDAIRVRRALRNKLVHAYSDASYDIEVYEQASELGDVYNFIKIVNRLLGKG